MIEPAGSPEPGPAGASEQYLGSLTPRQCENLPSEELFQSVNNDGVISPQCIKKTYSKPTHSPSPYHLSITPNCFAVPATEEFTKDILGTNSAMPIELNNESRYSNSSPSPGSPYHLSITPNCFAVPNTDELIKQIPCNDSAIPIEPNRINNHSNNGHSPFHLSITPNCFEIPATEEIPGTDSEMLAELNRKSRQSVIVVDTGNGARVNKVDKSGPDVLQQQVIIVEPINSNLNMLFNNDLEFAKYIDMSPFSKLSNLQVNKNFTKKIFILKFKKVDDASLQNLLLIDTLGHYSIKCRLPVSQQTSRGVIGPIGLETSEEDLFENLRGKYRDITGVKRLMKGSQKSPTLSMLLTFSTDVLPPHVYIGYSIFRIRTFVPSPWQCYNCQRFGHNAEDCKSKARCLICAGDHSSNTCPRKSEEARVPNNELKCANCGGSHAANYGGCSKIKSAKEVEKVRAHNKLSYRDALTAIKANHQPSSEHPHSPCPQSLSRYSTIKRTDARTISTQTDSNYKEADNELAKKFAMLLVGVVKCLDLPDGNSKVANVISLAKDMIGVDINANVIDNLCMNSAAASQQQQVRSQPQNYTSSRVIQAELPNGAQRQQPSNTESVKKKRPHSPKKQGIANDKKAKKSNKHNSRP